MLSTVINVNPKIIGGTPAFAGTRVPVESLFDYLKRSRNIDYFLEQFRPLNANKFNNFRRY